MKRARALRIEHPGRAHIQLLPWLALAGLLLAIPVAFGQGSAGQGSMGQGTGGIGTTGPTSPLPSAPPSLSGSGAPQQLVPTSPTTGNRPDMNGGGTLQGSNGVIQPPAQVDPGMKRVSPPAQAFPTPIVPPPGTPGGNPNVIAK